VTEETYNPESVKENLARLVADKVIELFGDDIANPSQEPIRLAYQIKVAEFILDRDNRK
jgi:hypothetical protein